MDHLPVIRLELESIRHTVGAMLRTRNDDINAMVLSALEKQLTAEWVQESIDRNVKKCIESAISDLSGNWQLKNAIAEVICETISKKFKQE